MGFRASFIKTHQQSYTPWQQEAQDAEQTTYLESPMVQQKDQEHLSRCEGSLLLTYLTPKFHSGSHEESMPQERSPMLFPEEPPILKEELMRRGICFPKAEPHLRLTGEQKTGEAVYLNINIM